MAKVAITPIIPKKMPMLKVSAWKKAVTTALDDTAKLALRRFHDATDTWKHKPRFIVQVGEFSRNIRVESVIFTYVDEGTKPHIIKPRRARFLRFGTPFIAKTVPSVLASRAGSRGNTQVFAKVVRHPGSKPRGFTKRITEQATVDMIRLLRSEIDRLQ